MTLWLYSGLLYSFIKPRQSLALHPPPRTTAAANRLHHRIPWGAVRDGAVVKVCRSTSDAVKQDRRPLPPFKRVVGAIRKVQHVVVHRGARTILDASFAVVCSRFPPGDAIA